MSSLEITGRDISNAGIPIGRKIRARAPDLESRIKRSSRTENPSGVSDAITSFFVVQHAVYDKIRKGSMNSSEATVFSNYVAAKYSSELLDYGGNVTFDGFATDKLKFGDDFFKIEDTLLDLYSDAVSKSKSVPLESVTDAFFDWTMRESLSAIENSYRSVLGKVNGTKSITVNGKNIPLTFQEHKQEKKSRASTVDVSKYQTSGVATPDANGQKVQNDYEFISGHEDVKAELQRVVRRMNHLQEYLQLAPQRKVIKNLLLNGPPGTGKTTLARMLQHMTGFLFYDVKCGDLVSKFNNESSQKIIDLYEGAKNAVLASEVKGAIIYFDEIDQIAMKRSSNPQGGERDDNKVVTTLNGCLQDYLGVPIITIGSTNKKSSMDPAIANNQRFKVLEVGYPKTDEGVVGIYQAIINKIESYASTEIKDKRFGGQIFDQIDADPILAITRTGQEYSSGRVIDNVLYDCLLERFEANIDLGIKQRITTADVCNKLLTYDFSVQMEDDPQKYSRLLGEQATDGATTSKPSTQTRTAV